MDIKKPNRTPNEDGNNTENRNVRRSNARTGKNKNMDIITKMSIVGGLGLVCILIIVGIIAFAIRDRTPDQVADEDKQNEEQQEPDLEDNEDSGTYIRALALVKGVDIEKNELAVVNIEDDTSIILKMDGAVDIKDEFGSLLSLGQLKVGSIVEIKYDEGSLRPEEVHISAQTWERKNIQSIQINEEAKTIQLGNDVYQYTKDLVTLYGKKEIELEQLDPVDLVSVVGYKDKIWTITLEKGHGYIVLQNHNQFIGGSIEIGKTTQEIEEQTKVTVLVGVQNIIVSKEGMTPYNAQVIVEEGKEVIVDVGTAQPTTGAVSFNISPSGAVLYINDRAYSDYSSPISLNFGSYGIRVEKDSYVAHKGTLVVNKAVMTVDVNLEEKPTYMHVDGPTGASLYIDGTYIGIIPTQAPIDPGSHEVTIRKDGFYSKIHSIEIKNNGKDEYFSFPELIPMPEEDDNE